MKGEFIRVTKRDPCPICKKPDWCEITADGRGAICMRVESQRKTRNGGWWHWLKDAPPERLLLNRKVQENTKRTPAELLRMMDRWAAKTTDEMMGALGTALGVATWALSDMGAVYADVHSAWAFPMRRFNGELAGIRLRAATGKKWAVAGSRDGLFFGVNEQETIDTLFVCEGPTDTAAALTIGLCAVGRPSCRGARMEVKLLAYRWGAKRVCVVADQDKPGQDGGIELCRRMGMAAAMIVPPAKDMRVWVKKGAKRADVEKALEQTEWKWRWA
jgi:5S rRNA maturation endonuclease (ribonuclease M5)